MTTKDQDLDTYGENLESSDTISPFPKTLRRGGTRLLVFNEKTYQDAIGQGYIEYTLTDKGHKTLVGYLGTLLECAMSGDFHDFASTTGAPKINLRNQLLDLAQKVVDGDFDN